jgi:uncharacterized protein (DUF2235 family)
MKRLVFCFDGTWNTIDMPYPTNVTKIAQAVSRADYKDVVQVIHYDEGVGTGDKSNVLGRAYNFLAGAIGSGLIENITEAYKFLVLNYEPGDQIHVFGFSRGAFSARSFVGLIRHNGVISRRSIGKIHEAVERYLSRKPGDDPDSDQACKFRFDNCYRSLLGRDRLWRSENAADVDYSDVPDLKISFLGVWDTVGALGLPERFGIAKIANRKYQFHDVALTPFVERARHAVAADEKRRTFEPSLWDAAGSVALNKNPNYLQKVFPGTHCGVGGGGPVRGISDAALDWILRGAREAGLAFDTDERSPIFGLQPDWRAQLHNEVGKLDWKFKDKAIGFGLRDRNLSELVTDDVHEFTIRRVQEPADRLPEKKAYAPPALAKLLNEIRVIDTKDKAKIDDQLIQTKSLWADVGLRAPDSIKHYTIQPGDTLERIAERHFGNKDLSELILIHNQNAGLLYRAAELYAGRTLELPVYDELKLRNPS